MASLYSISPLYFEVQQEARLIASAHGVSLLRKIHSLNEIISLKNVDVHKVQFLIADYLSCYRQIFLRGIF